MLANSKRILFGLILFIAYCSAINPWTIELMDSRPPLSASVVVTIWYSYVIVFLLILLSVFLGFTVTYISFFLLLIIEVSLRLIVPLYTHETFRMTRPEPYSTASYFSEEFLKESFEQPGGYRLDESSGAIYPSNFSGAWFNVSNELRQTVGQPSNPEITIYLFGGSTVYNSEVPDDLTIASQLQALTINNINATVINVGVNSVHSAQQLARLKADFEITKDDIVIFYDGVNDVAHRLIYGNKKGFMYGQPEGEEKKIRVLRELKKYVFIVRWILNLTQDVPRHYSNDEIDTAVNGYISVLDNTNEYVKEKGARFFHFLQPTLFTKIIKNEYENRIIKIGAPLVTKVGAMAHEQMYPLVQKKLLSRLFSTDLSNIFNNLPSSPFLDFSHINHVGNKVVAQKINDRLLKELE